MSTFSRFRRGFFLSLILSFLIPIPAGVLTYFVLQNYFNSANNILAAGAIGAVCLVGFSIAVVTYWRIALPLQDIYKHADAIKNNNLNYRTTRKVGGLFGEITQTLNKASDKLQQYYTSEQTQEQVIESEANRLRYVINSIKDGVIALDKDNRILLFNNAASEISGYKIGEAAGMPVGHILPLMRGYELALNEWVAASQAQGKAMDHQHWEGLKLKTKTGIERSVDVDALYQGTDPNGIRSLVTFHDRTAAQEVEDMKVDFVALAAHELRTPITVIRGYLELLDSELTDTLSPEHKEFMRKLNVSASQLSGFINNILNVSRIEHGNLNLKLERTNWTQLVKATCEDLAKKVALQNKKLGLTIAANVPEVAVDKMSIIEVVNNLVDNAVKYSPAGSRVDVTVRTKNDMIETVIEDHGAGIPENALGQLFTKFYRSHRTRGSHQGTGLGLYMSKGIIEAHGGSIWVRSKEGVGSTFGFLLPTYAKVAAGTQSIDNSSKVTRGVHGWIKNHSLYRG